MNAIDEGKTMAIDASKKIVEKAGKELSSPKSHVDNAMVSREEITKKGDNVIAKYVDTILTN